MDSSFSHQSICTWQTRSTKNCAHLSPLTRLSARDRSAKGVHRNRHSSGVDATGPDTADLLAAIAGLADLSVICCFTTPVQYCGIIRIEEFTYKAPLRV